jgi:hypothetical protein
MSGNYPIDRRFKNWVGQVDWPLLLFVAGATYVKLYIKIAAIVCYAAWLLFKKARWQRPPGPAWFYIAMPVLGTAVAAIHGSFNAPGYYLGAAIGSLQWLACAGTVYLLFVAAKNGSSDQLLATVKGFFALNALATLFQFLVLVVQSKHAMPYWFYDSGLKYGSSTGDNLKGIFMHNSLNNAAATLIGVLFFITRGERLWTGMCIIVLLMCTSNVVTFGMLALFILLLALGSGKRIRLHLLQMMLLVAVVYPTLSPQNFEYVQTVFRRMFSPSKPFIAAENPEADTIILHKDTPSKKEYSPARSLSLHIPDSIYQRMPKELVALREYSLHMEKPAWSYLILEPAALRTFFKRWYGVSPDSTLLAHYDKPAKLFAIRQTVGYLNRSPMLWLSGIGMGNFSSKLAIKMTGVRWQGTFPDDKIYISRPFAEYHFYTLTYVFSRDIREHSVVNMPAATYLQLAGEYGIVGLLLCAVLYFGWFWLRSKNYKAGRWMLLAMLGLFWLDYWYEMMTLTVVAEFCMLYGIFGRSRENA